VLKTKCISVPRALRNLEAVQYRGLGEIAVGEVAVSA
jgi:hypothetical protein